MAKRVLSLLSSTISAPLFGLNVLHIFNDGFQASLILMLPFIAHDFHISLTQVGFLKTLMDILNLVLAIPAGYIATRVGGLKTLVIGVFLYGLGYLGTGFAPSYFFLFPVFLLSGIAFGVFNPIGTALAAKFSAKESRGKNLGNFNAVGDLGRVGITALVTVIVAAIGWRGTTSLFAFIAFCTGIIFYLLFLHKKEHFVEKGKKIIHINIWSIITNKQFLLAILTSFFDSFASSAFFLFLPFLLLKHGVSPALLGFFAAIFFMGAIAGRTNFGKLSDKYSKEKIFIVSEVLMALFIFFLTSTNSFFLLIICAFILGVFTRGTTPLTQTMASEVADHHGNYEKIFGVRGFTNGIAIATAPILFGFISDKIGISIAFYLMAAAALLATVPALGFYFSKRK
jgi:MFS family permease